MDVLDSVTLGGGVEVNVDDAACLNALVPVLVIPPIAAT